MYYISTHIYAYPNPSQSQYDYAFRSRITRYPYYTMPGYQPAPKSTVSIPSSLHVRCFPSFHMPPKKTKTDIRSYIKKCQYILGVRVRVRVRFKS